MPSSIQQLAYSEPGGPAPHVIDIQRFPLYGDDTHRVPPLPVRDTVSPLVPERLVQHDVFRTGEIGPLLRFGWQGEFSSSTNW